MLPSTTGQAMHTRHTPQDAESATRPVPEPAARFVRRGEPGASTNELLDRLEQKAGELSQAQERLEAAVAALEAERAKRGRLAKALDTERKARKAAEAAARSPGLLDDLVAERDALLTELEDERAERARVEAELEAANLQTAGLEERLTVAWEHLSEAEAQAQRPRGLKRLRRRGRA
jgi:chromosome segregation ATPase